MELLPFLELDTVPTSGLWYVVSFHGDPPSMRVGHEAVVIETDDGQKIYMVGGANPGECFNSTHVFDVAGLSWETVGVAGLRARYEHASFIPASQPTRIYVFGGADISGNMNDVSVLDVAKSSEWTPCDVTGHPPSARTHHTGAVVGDKLVIYSGGHAGADPVGDRQVHCFDASTVSWTTLDAHGDAPKPRHGHVMAAVGSVVFLHGGMAGTTFYDDLHTLDLEKKKWSVAKKRATRPCARAAHGSAVYDVSVYMFGGMNRDGALDDLWKLDTTTLSWTLIKVNGPPPPARLDFAMCIVGISRRQSLQNDKELLAASAQAQEVIERELKPGSGSSHGSGSVKLGEDVVTVAKEPSCDTHDDPASTDDPGMSLSPPQTYPLCVIHGGTDTNGHLFDDILCIRIEPGEMIG